MTGYEKFVVLITVAGALFAAALELKLALAELRGWRPKRGSYTYNRTLALINFYNQLAGLPHQSEPYEWQWQTRAYTSLGLVAVCIIWVVVGMVMLLRS